MRLSDRLIDRIDEFLSHPEYDPHGDPIPCADGSLRGEKATLIPLADCDEQSEVIVSRVSDHDPALLRHLSGFGIDIGSKVTIESNSTTTGLITLISAGEQVALGHPAASQIFVQFCHQPAC